MVSRVLFKSASQEWRTPRNVYESLDVEFQFNHDPCPSNSLVDGLKADWISPAFVNPPFSDIAKWVEKAFAEHSLGKTVVLLIPARTDTRWWHKYVMQADEIRFLQGRIGYERSDGKRSRATFPSCVVVFKGRDKILWCQPLSHL